MSVLSRPRHLLHVPALPRPRPSAHDEGPATTGRPRSAEPTGRTPRRSRAALLLVALVAAIAAVVAVAAGQLTGDEPTRLAPGAELSGTSELQHLEAEKRFARSNRSDAQRASDAARDVVETGG